jgi:hypothetical protein
VPVITVSPSLVGANAIQVTSPFAGFFSTVNEGRGHGIADADRMAEAQILTEIDRARARQFGAEHGGNQAGPPHAVNDDVVEHIGLGKSRIDMGGIHIAGDGCEQIDIPLTDGMR